MIYYIDTSSLMYRYIGGNPKAYIDPMLDQAENEAYTSEWTILEWSSALGKVHRENKLNYDSFKKNELALMTDIANERLQIEVTNRTIEKARTLVEYVGVVHGRGLRTGDSIQLVAALALATRVNTLVEFVTSDLRLANITNDLDIFKPYLRTSYLQP